jgi:hypothetical protein
MAVGRYDEHRSGAGNAGVGLAVSFSKGRFSKGRGFP